MDNLYRIQAVNPELAMLIRRAKAIYAICGGEISVTTAGKKDDYATKKSILIAELHQFESLIDARDNSGLPKDGRDYIRLKMQVNSELERLERSVDDLAVSLKRELEKNGKSMTPDELRAHRDVFQSIRTEYHAVYKKAKGYSHTGADDEGGAGAAGLSVMTAEQLAKGQFAGAGVKTEREEMTGEQAQKLMQIQQERQKQDGILDEMGKQLDELKDIAERMHDELQMQDKMLSDLEDKTDKTQGKLDATNDRMKDVLKSLNDKSSNACVYIICIVLLLGIVTVAYNMITKK